MEADRLGHSKVVKGSVVVVVDSSVLMQIADGIVAPSMIEEAVGARVRLVAPEAVVRELERLATTHRRPKVRRLARLALSLVEMLGVDVVGGLNAGNADDAVEALALSLRASGARVAVATSDRELRRRVRMHGIPTIYYRESEGRLEADWDVDL